MSRRRWFLPETPDVLGMLRRQAAVTMEGLDAFAAWAAGDPAAGRRLREAEERGDGAKREVLNALRAAFVIPMEPEDVFALSRGIDRILDHARDLVDESVAMATRPDEGIAEMARLLGEAVRHVDEALARIKSDADATEAADAAIRVERELERTYYTGMAALLGVQDQTDRIARRELYRRCNAIGENVVDVAERIVYAVVKQS
jgi:uncharacterized protein Yka (UPF0111/DUF47 family)